MADDIDNPLVGVLERIPKVNSLFCAVGIKFGASIVGIVGIITAIFLLTLDVLELAFISDVESLNQKWSIRSEVEIIAFDMLTETIYIFMFLHLILGIKQSKPKYVFAFIVAGLPLILCKLSVAFLFGLEGEFSFCLVAVFYSLLHIYFLLVVNSYFFQMETDGGDLLYD